MNSVVLFSSFKALSRSLVFLTLCPVTSPEFVCTKSYLPKDAKEPIETEETYTLEELEEYIRRLKVAADVKKNSQNAG